MTLSVPLSITTTVGIFGTLAILFFEKDEARHFLYRTQIVASIENTSQQMINYSQTGRGKGHMIRFLCQ